ncbi:MAG: hypothetical protein KC592_07455 [Nitrospira sp.]|nr:hypothetical protein [Nitrospira sp.]
MRDRISFFLCQLGDLVSNQDQAASRPFLTRPASLGWCFHRRHRSRSMDCRGAVNHSNFTTETQERCMSKPIIAMIALAACTTLPGTDTASTAPSSSTCTGKWNGHARVTFTFSGNTVEMCNSGGCWKQSYAGSLNHSVTFFSPTTNRKFTITKKSWGYSAKATLGSKRATASLRCR